MPPCRYSVSSYASIAPDQAPSPFLLSLCLPFFPSPLATLKASWRTVWNLIGWYTIGSPQGGMAKCPEPSLVMRLADKRRTWGIGPILFTQRMVQSPSGPCKEMLGFFCCVFFFLSHDWWVRKMVAIPVMIKFRMKMLLHVDDYCELQSV